MTSSVVTPYNSNYLGCFPFSNTCINILLAASTAVSFTIPGDQTNSYRASFSVNATSDVWVRNGGTAAVPTTGVVASLSNQERIGTNFVRYVRGGDVLSFISTGTPQVGMSLLQMPN